MAIFVESADLPYAPTGLFDLVADVESYPRFLPWCAAVRIRERRPDGMLVEQVARLGPLRTRFITTAELHRPDRILVTCDQGPMLRFRQDWSFQPGPRGGTRVTFTLDLDIGAGLWRALLSRRIAALARSAVAAFAQRARQLLGPAEADQDKAMPTASSSE